MADLSLATWTPSRDPMRLPEIRHNLRLITDVCKKDVDDFARDAKASDERKRYIEQEDILLRKKIIEEAQRTLGSSPHAQCLTSHCQSYCGYSKSTLSQMK
jgi:hypothetical protein